MIVPTVARMLWYRANVGDIVPSRGDEPLAAILAGVVDDSTVNLAVFGADGSGPYAKQNVVLTQEGEPAPGACCWMPFQKGQAAKVDELKDKLTEALKPSGFQIGADEAAFLKAQGESQALDPNGANATGGTPQPETPAQ